MKCVCVVAERRSRLRGTRPPGTNVGGSLQTSGLFNCVQDCNECLTLCASAVQAGGHVCVCPLRPLIPQDPAPSLPQILEAARAADTPCAVLPLARCEPAALRDALTKRCWTVVPHADAAALCMALQVLRGGRQPHADCRLLLLAAAPALREMPKDADFQTCALPPPTVSAELHAARTAAVAHVVNYPVLSDTPAVAQLCTALALFHGLMRARQSRRSAPGPTRPWPIGTHALRRTLAFLAWATGHETEPVMDFDMIVSLVRVCAVVCRAAGVCEGCVPL